MIRKLATVVILLLAMHFVAIVGGVAYLAGTGKIDREKIKQIAEIVAPTPVPATQPSAATQPSPTQPLLRFDDLLAQQTGKTASEQTQFLRETFDGLSVQLDRQYRELLDLRRQVELAQTQINSDRAAVEAREKAIADREASQAALLADEGFQRTLEIYTAMPPRQLKDVFMALDEALVARYLQSMEPKRVATLTKEFKAPHEVIRANALIERLRRGDTMPAEAAADSR